MSVTTSANMLSGAIGGRRHSGQASDGVQGCIQLGWFDIFETGHTEIDAFHRKLIQNCNGLLVLVDNDAGWSLIVDEARKFVGCCIEHFPHGRIAVGTYEISQMR
jgi:hypothetical protein